MATNLWSGLLARDGTQGAQLFNGRSARGYVAEVGYDIPADLVAVQRAFFAADAQCEALAATHPTASEVIAGQVELTQQQHTTYMAARAERDRLRVELQSHPWWNTVDNRHQARLALHTAARASNIT